MSLSGQILEYFNVLLARIERRIEVVKAPRKDPNQVFNGRELIKVKDLYWMLHPMPSENELDLYYRNDYWNHRTQSSLVSERDVLHFKLLITAVPDFFKVKRKIMNYGAGRGGISYLLSAAGHEVINIEPSSHNQAPDFGIQTFSSLEEYAGRDIDLVYGSHSLEHVHDVHFVLGAINARLKPESLSFWEVPNALGPGNGPIESEIFIPHTYYFTRNFFDVSYQVVHFNLVGTDKKNITPDSPLEVQFEESVNGDVIRFLGSGYSI